MAENESYEPSEEPEGGPPESEPPPGDGDDRPPPESGETGLPARLRGAVPDVARKGVLAFSLGWAGLTFFFPLLLLTWVLALLLGVVLIAEALEETEGLVATTFGAGYMAGTVAVFGLALVMVLIKVVWRDQPDRFWRRTVSHPALVPGVAVVLCAFFSFVLEDGGTDLPDALTTAAFLGLWDWVLFLLPLWLAVAAFKWSWKSFRWAGAGPYRTGLLSGLAMGLGLLGTVELVTLDEHADEDIPKEIEAILDAVGRAPSTGDFIDDTHAVFSAVAAVVPYRPTRTELPRPGLRIPPGGFPPQSPGYRDAFGECAEDLARPARGSSEVDQAIGRLVMRGTDRETAKDVVSMTLIVVCEKYAEGEVESYVPYFVIAVRNNARNAHRGNRLIYCDINDLYDRGVWDAPQGGSEMRDTHRALCGLSEKDRRVLLLASEGYSSEELAQALGTTSASARQQLRRARARFRERL